MPLQLNEKPFDIKAWERFLELGIPNKENEAYQYVHLKELLSHPFHLATPLNSSIEPRVNQLVFINGFYSEADSLPPPSLIVLPLSRAFKTYGSFLNARLQKLQQEEKDPFALLNSAYYQEGLFLYLPPKTICQTPIRILHLIDNHDQPTLIAPRIHLFLGKESSLQLSYEQTISQANVWTNGYIDCALDERSSLTFERFSQQRTDSHDFLALRATLKQSSTLHSCSATNGGATSREDYSIHLLGKEANASLYGVWRLKEERQHHVHVLIDHQEPHCTSLQKFKGVLNDSSRSSFEGKIYVHQKAQKTQAYQMNHNLLVGTEASAHCKPNLEIFADDVKASHGATIGQINEEHLLYLTTRGIPAAQARRLLLDGFTQEITELFKIVKYQS